MSELPSAPTAPGFVGGRRAALEALEAVDAVAYARTRNHVDGAVTRLSPYLRHGVLSLAEVRDHVLDRYDAHQAYKLVDELGWRDFFRRAYGRLGWTVWSDLTAYQTGWAAGAYADHLPDDIAQGQTGLACVDAWVHELTAQGWLHNHVRMWLASYVVHHRRVRWQAGARWFLTHLLDGDTASNNLSWQWVASTWRRTPYIFNRANLVKYAGRRWCEGCVLENNGCPFAGSYEGLNETLFASSGPAPGVGAVDRRAVLRAGAASDAEGFVPARSAGTVLVWVHGERLSPTNEAVVAYPEAQAHYVWDHSLLRDSAISAKRVAFMTQCLAELPDVHVSSGDVVAQLVAAAREVQARVIATTPTPSPRFARFVAELEAQGLEVQVWPEQPFARPATSMNLSSHAAYWKQARSSVFG